MKNFTKKFFCLLVFIQLLNIVKGQQYSWVILSDSMSGGFHLFSSVNSLATDKQRNVYAVSGTLCFGVGMYKFNGILWKPVISGCDETDMFPLKKDSAENVYGLVYNYNIPYLYSDFAKSNGNTVTIIDTTHLYCHSNFIVSNAGRIYSNVYKCSVWDYVINNWVELKGTGADTLGKNNTVFPRVTDSAENMYALVSDIVLNKGFVGKWDGTKWKRVATNDSILKGPSGYLGKDLNDNIYADEIINSTSGYKYTAYLNKATNLWEEVTSTMNSPYFYDTCIDFKTIKYDKQGNYYSISKCNNTSGIKYIAKWNGTAWTELGTFPANKYLNALAIDNMGNVYAGGELIPNPYYRGFVAKYSIITPVKLSDYEVSAVVSKDGLNTIINKWQTLTEVNASYFNIQRSINAKEFITIGKVAATNKPDTYSFIDPLAINYLLPATFYYRLEIVDKDGHTEYSPVKQMTLKKQIFTDNMLISPNPVKDKLNIQIFNNKIEKLIIQITDLQGKVLQQQEVQLKAEINSISFNTTTLAKGNYLFVLKGKEKQVKLFVKE